MFQIVAIINFLRADFLSISVDVGGGIHFFNSINERGLNSYVVTSVFLSYAVREYCNFFKYVDPLSKHHILIFV